MERIVFGENINEFTLLDFLHQPDPLGHCVKRGDLRQHMLAGAQTGNRVVRVRDTIRGQQHGIEVHRQKLGGISRNVRTGIRFQKTIAHVLVVIATSHNIEIQRPATVVERRPASQSPNSQANLFVGLKYFFH